MQEESLSNKPRKKKSVTQYASSVFKTSSVSAVSGIISTTSLPRKVFRAVIFLIVTVGFLYQCIKFLTFYFEYPTAVEISILQPEKYMTPGFTFCNNERVKRSKYCNKYPDHCIVPSKEYCKKHSKYCGEDETKVPKEEYMSLEFSLNEVYELGHEFDDLVYSHHGRLKGFETNVSVIRFRYESIRAVSLCYTFNNLIKSSEEHLYTNTEPYKLFDNKDYYFVFNPEESDMFDDDLKPGVYFSVHSPFDAVNPFERGFFMKPGRYYKFSVWMEEKKLLTYPYKTDCMNYIEIWLNNNKTGPRSRKMCQEKCAYDLIWSCLNCTFPFLKYPLEKNYICDMKKVDEGKIVSCYGSVENFSELLLECTKKCKEECHKWKYFPEMRQLYVSRKSSNRSRHNSNYIYVDITMEDREIISYKYRPQYQNIEAFSYIGGFIGMWLGVSLVQVSEFLESAFLIGRYVFKKRQLSRETNV